MTLLVAGLALFLGIHLVPAIPPLRAAWAAAAGENRYKGMFSLIAGAGLALIVAGYYVAPRGAQLFTPVPAAQSIAPLAMIVSFALLASSHMKTHVRARLGHPMLIGIILWAGVHLLANGDVRGTVLFASFLAYAVVDLVSALARHAVKPFVPSHRQDVMAVVSGVALAALVMLFHRFLFGVPAVWWSL